ncbi:hypothetical protein DFP92_106167 [Yoonia sediminilitoris]|uniref:Uncharacterized protein n=1 Tax=Yoonia sediminilitoris TaxID=1286148 RepID=A0A2T6KG49_9RHOB|nr:hypothetical protein C8N45_106167 [Yoonia sediminilitoris]RCW95224.1 hypothetical protein DFP92_106167 [Yoonia sediminilitoris]
MIRRITGQMPGQYLSTLVTTPLGADVWVGVPASELPRVAPSVAMPGMEVVAKAEREKNVGEGIYGPYRTITLGAAMPECLVTEDGGFNGALRASCRPV